MPPGTSRYLSAIGREKRKTGQGIDFHPRQSAGARIGRERASECARGGRGGQEDGGREGGREREKERKEKSAGSTAANTLLHCTQLGRQLI